MVKCLYLFEKKILRYQPYQRYPNSANSSASAVAPQSQPLVAVKTEATVSTVSTSGAPLSPLLEPHSNTPTPIVDEPHLPNSRQRHGDDGTYL